jgi:hypothetical protein
LNNNWSGSDTHWSSLTYASTANDTALLGAQQPDNWTVILPKVFSTYQLTIDMFNGVSDINGSVNVSVRRS